VDDPGSRIGVPIPDLDVRVVDALLRPVPVGVPGELLVVGDGVGRGYLRRPELTAERFIEDPLGSGRRCYRSGDLVRRDGNGDLEYLGRIDAQVKVRGFRIELGEIEAALHSLPGLRESAVVAIQSEGFEGWLICCAYVPAPDNGVSTKSLRKDLAALVPGYMLPARWMRYDVLPKNDNGKIDRPQLKNAFLYAEPRPVRAKAMSVDNARATDRRISAA
jgi:acyl-coenzyme A synthetase/AMP-(fatty) acid ligase